MSFTEILRNCTIANRYRIELYLGEYRNSRDYLSYRFYDTEVLIFEGSDFGASPCHGIDSDETLVSLLGFLSLKQGDTDREYFDSYTPAQIAWRDAYAEDLSIHVLDIEEGFEKFVDVE